MAASLTLLLVGAPAAVAAKRITGKLSQPRFTVIALDSGGEAASKRTKPNGKFKLRPPAKRVTLHLRATDGINAGPIVIDKKGKKGRKAILGVKAGAALGKVRVKNGFAKLKRDLPDEDVDRKRRARARRGVPIGARVFGLVTAQPTGTSGPGQDQDRDGIPGALDIDDDGDRILDNLDVSGKPAADRSARGVAPQGCGPADCPIASGLTPAAFEGTANVNALALAGLTPEAIRQQANALLSSVGTLRFSFPVLGDSVELDCGGMPDPLNPDGWIGGRTYCTRGGTGIASAGGPGPDFPECCDTEDPPDGFGTILPPPTPSGSFLRHGATTAEIKPGDPLPQRVTSGETETEALAALNFVFVTVPALASYSDTAGNCAKVSGTPGECATEFSYPVDPGDPGTTNNGFPVSAPVGEDVVLTLTFWRPQRTAVPGSSDPPTAAWMDIGHLRYGAGSGGACQQSTLSPTDPNELAPSTLPLLGAGGLEDQGGDQESSPANTFTYTLNLSECLDAAGLSFGAGEERPVTFSAVSSGGIDTAHQTVTFERQ